MERRWDCENREFKTKNNNNKKQQPIIYISGKKSCLTKESFALILTFLDSF